GGPQGGRVNQHYDDPPQELYSTDPRIPRAGAPDAGTQTKRLRLVRTGGVPPVLGPITPIIEEH
ncbi:MAG: hypothetical protein ACE5HE_13765, partial [Phycisphaerae bacterium]